METLGVSAGRAIVAWQRERSKLADEQRRMKQRRGSQSQRRRTEARGMARRQAAGGILAWILRRTMQDAQVAMVIAAWKVAAMWKTAWRQASELQRQEEQMHFAKGRVDAYYHRYEILDKHHEVAKGSRQAADSSKPSPETAKPNRQRLRF